MKHWSAGFVGIPWGERGRDRAGVDCWGLVRLVYAEALHIALPSYTDRYACVAERREIAAVISADAAQWPWREVAEEREFDVVLFKRAGLEHHVGIVIAPGRMLHIPVDMESRIEVYTSGRWAHRLAGIYRHANVAHA